MDALSSEHGLEERLKRVEELLTLVLERLEKIEELVSGGLGEEVYTATRLVAAYSLPVIEALKASRRLLEATRQARLQLDEISRVILEVLSDCKPKTLSEITRLVRQTRGKASRRIIRKRINKLAQIGIIKDTGTSNRHQYQLTTCR